jgi:hypothetical protein
VQAGEEAKGFLGGLFHRGQEAVDDTVQRAGESAEDFKRRTAEAARNAKRTASDTAQAGTDKATEVCFICQCCSVFVCDSAVSSTQRTLVLQQH